MEMTSRHMSTCHVIHSLFLWGTLIYLSCIVDCQNCNSSNIVKYPNMGGVSTVQREFQRPPGAKDSCVAWCIRDKMCKAVTTSVTSDICLFHMEVDDVACLETVRDEDKTLWLVVNPLLESSNLRKVLPNDLIHWGLVTPYKSRWGLGQHWCRYCLRHISSVEFCNIPGMWGDGGGQWGMGVWWGMGWGGGWGWGMVWGVGGGRILHFLKLLSHYPGDNELISCVYTFKGVNP